MGGYCMEVKTKQKTDRRARKLEWENMKWNNLTIGCH